MAANQHPVRSWLRYMDPDANDGAITFQEACVTAGSLQMDDLEEPIVTKRDPGPLHPSGLPFRAINYQGDSLVHFIDALINFPEPDFGSRALPLAPMHVHWFKFHRFFVFCPVYCSLGSQQPAMATNI